METFQLVKTNTKRVRLAAALVDEVRFVTLKIWTLRITLEYPMHAHHHVHEKKIHTVTYVLSLWSGNCGGTTELDQWTHAHSA